MNVLITPDEVLRFFPGNSIDPNLFSSVIFMAEQRFVVPILGPTFYQQFCTQKNVTVTSGNITELQAYFTNRNITLNVGDIVNAIDLPTVNPVNATLWNNVLWPYISECIKFTALPSNYAKFTSQGIVKNNPAHTFIDSSNAGTSSGISLDDLKYLRNDVLLQNISILEDTLKTYLFLNATLYPCVPNIKNEDKEKSRKSGLVFIYDEDDCDNRRERYMPPPSPNPVTVPYTMTCSITALIKTSPDGSTYTLCNLQTIPAQYPIGNTLTLSNLIGKYVTGIMTLNGNTVSIPYNAATGTFDNTAGGGFNDGDTFIFLYNEKMSS